MNSLALYNTEHIDNLVWPLEEKTISLHAPAFSVFTDFTLHSPLVIEGNVKAVELERLMRQAHVKMKIVVDKNKNFLGIISLQELNEEKILAKVTRDQPRDELLVSDFMLHRNQLKAFDYHQLLSSTVGDVLETQQNCHQQHCLVINRDKHEIRGLISVSDVIRLLKLPIDIQSHPSFSRLFREIAA